MKTEHVPSHSGRLVSPGAILLVASAIVAIAMSACNTVSGVGKDLQESSDSVKKAMQD